MDATDPPASANGRPDAWNELASRVLAGGSLTRNEALDVLRAPDVDVPALLAATFRVRRRHFGLKVQLYYLQNAKSGLCPEDCGYCSQSLVSTAEIDRYPLLSERRLLEGAAAAAGLNSRTYCIVTSGRGPTEREVEHLARTVEKIKAEHGLHICCCLGLLEPDQARRLKDAGVDRINHNLNTSRRFYGQICSTHTYQDRLDTLRVVRQAGLELCSGLIVGMGEADEDVVEVALELERLGVESIPVNFLIPIPGTPLEDRRDTLNPRYCLKVLCLLRLTNPATEIRIAGGREVHLRTLQPLGLYAANSIFVSDYLTTKGQAPEDDFRMIEDLGFELVAPSAGEPDSTDRRLTPAASETTDWPTAPAPAAASARP
ncbi:MAG TPA: biotin synthase BioB [Planctomycetaceae bacterium]|nr:biotin synthase BioB [Planctomycetaceae bacterium]